MVRRDRERENTNSNIQSTRSERERERETVNQQQHGEERNIIVIESLVKQKQTIKITEKS